MGAAWREARTRSASFGRRRCSCWRGRSLHTRCFVLTGSTARAITHPGRCRGVRHEQPATGRAASCGRRRPSCRRDLVPAYSVPGCRGSAVSPRWLPPSRCRSLRSPPVDPLPIVLKTCPCVMTYTICGLRGSNATASGRPASGGWRQGGDSVLAAGLARRQRERASPYWCHQAQRRRRGWPPPQRLPTHAGVQGCRREYKENLARAIAVLAAVNAIGPGSTYDDGECKPGGDRLRRAHVRHGAENAGAVGAIHGDMRRSPAPPSVPSPAPFTQTTPCLQCAQQRLRLAWGRRARVVDVTGDVMTTVYQGIAARPGVCG